MVRYLILSLCLLIARAGLGQQDELSALCERLDKTLSGPGNLHARYSLTITSRDELSDRQTLVSNLYKNGASTRIQMGDMQDIFFDGRVSLLINHVQKVMVLEEGGAAGQGSFSMVENLTLLAREASGVVRSEKNGLISFVLTFPREFMYAKARIEFSARDKTLKNIYADFSPSYPEPYHSMELNYQIWDQKWKPGPDFQGPDHYVRKDADGYKTMDRWRDYQLYQPQYGTLKF